MAILKVKDANGNVIDIPAIRGEKGKDGYTPVKGVDYFDGKDYVLTEADKQEIADLVGGGTGGGGTDGFSPIVEVEAIEGGHRVTITDSDGTESFDILNGIDGKDGVDGKNGTDYVLTNADKQEIAEMTAEIIDTSLLSAIGSGVLE